MNPDELLDLLQQANAAIRRGANPDAVGQRISQVTGGRVNSVAQLGDVLQHRQRAAQFASEAEQIRAEAAPGMLRGATASLAQGGTLGLSDELSGGLSAIGAFVPGGRSPGQAYREAADEELRVLGQFGEEHPVVRGVTDVAGGLATGVLTGGLGLVGRGAATAGRLATIGRLARVGAVEGAAFGGIEGAARAEGGLVERGTAGAVGAGLGVGFGGLVGAATPLLSRAGAAGAGALVGAGTGVASADNDLVGGTAGAAAGAATGFGAGRLGGRLANRILESVASAGPVTSGERASLATLRALEREGITPAQLERLAAEAPDANLLELSGRVGTGSPVHSLARGAQSIPSRGSREIASFVGKQADEAPERIRRELQERTGLKFENVHDTVDDLAARQESAARPLYDEALEQAVSSDVVRRAFDEPLFQDAYRAAQEIAEREVRAGIQGARPLPQLFEQTDEGVRFLQRSVEVRAVDYMKKGLDAVIERGFRGGTLDQRNATLLRRQLNNMLEEVDELVPKYKEARQTWSGYERAQEMLQVASQGGELLVGRDVVRLRPFLNESPEKLQNVLPRLTSSERQLYLRGAVEDVRELLSRSEDTRADLSRLLIGRGGGEVVDSDMRKRLRLLFDSDRDMQEFVRSMLAERGRAQTGQFILGGSPTQRIAAEQADLGQVAAPVPTSARALTAEILRDRVGQFLQSALERQSNELAPRLTGPLSQTVPQVLGDFGRLGQRLTARTRLATRGGVTLGAGVGAALSGERATGR